MKKEKNIFKTTLIVTLVFMVAILTGCSSKILQPKKEASVNYPVTVKDDLGRVVKLDAKPKKIVSLSPASTETAFAIGLGNQIVGVDSFSDYPAQAKKKEKVGDFANLNMEKIVSLKPNLVLTAGGIQKPFVKRLEDAGLKVFVVEPVTVSGMIDTAKRLSKITGAGDKALEKIETLESRMAEIKEKSAKIENKPTIFYELYSEPLMTAGKKTSITDIIRLAGGISISGDLKEDYPQYSLEKLIESNPDIYLAASGSMSSPGDIKKRRGWQQLKAVKEGKVFVIDENIINRPGPRLVDAAEKVLDIISGSQANK